ncbi:hypothetical protein OE88DRAFT_1728130 [Heliocybe sulcata]|uniref:Uncharacterized protein n=1 Tax=Heliocybe sulcata TaxID=5364 RepID=A0A5C3MUG1_9AGAM|nr:hypothetical protein OE88DRAFT_1728130 [Heliocybe sulcata]
MSQWKVLTPLPATPPPAASIPMPAPLPVIPLPAELFVPIEDRGTGNRVNGWKKRKAMNERDRATCRVLFQEGVPPPVISRVVEATEVTSRRAVQNNYEVRDDVTQDKKHIPEALRIWVKQKRAAEGRTSPKKKRSKSPSEKENQPLEGQSKRVKEKKKHKKRKIDESQVSKEAAPKNIRFHEDEQVDELAEDDVAAPGNQPLETQSKPAKKKIEKKRKMDDNDVGKEAASSKRVRFTDEEVDELAQDDVAVQPLEERSKQVKKKKDKKRKIHESDVGKEAAPPKRVRLHQDEAADELALDEVAVPRHARALTSSYPTEKMQTQNPRANLSSSPDRSQLIDLTTEAKPDPDDPVSFLRWILHTGGIKELDCCLQLFAKHGVEDWDSTYEMLSLDDSIPEFVDKVMARAGWSTLRVAKLAKVLKQAAKDHT